MSDADIELLRASDVEKVTGFALNEKATTFWEPKDFHGKEPLG